MYLYLKYSKIIGTCLHLLCQRSKEPRFHHQLTYDFERVGLAYHEFHTQSMRDTEQSKPQNEMALHHKISNQSLLRKISVVFDKLAKNYLDTMRYPSITHGDAQPGNVLLTEDDVVFIDTGGVNLKMFANRVIKHMRFCLERFSRS